MSEKAIADVFWWNEERVRFGTLSVTRATNTESSTRKGTTLISGGYHIAARRWLSAGYRIYFPFDVDQKRVAYEVDKDNKRFVTVGIEQDNENLSSLAADLESDLRLEEENEPYVSFEDEHETITIPYKNCQDQDDPIAINSIKLAIAACVTREVKAIRLFIKESSDADILIKGKDDKG